MSFGSCSRRPSRALGYDPGMADIISLPVVERARKKAGKPEPVPYQWLCKRCEHDIGVATSTTLVITISPRVKGLKLTGGTKQAVCAYCWQRGIRTLAP